jgi:predicted RecB family endonuclease
MMCRDPWLGKQIVVVIVVVVVIHDLFFLSIVDLLVSLEQQLAVGGSGC